MDDVYPVRGVFGIVGVCDEAVHAGWEDCHGQLRWVQPGFEGEGREFEGFLRRSVLQVGK